jgi:hypothetical protein
MTACSSWCGESPCHCMKQSIKAYHERMNQKTHILKNGGAHDGKECNYTVCYSSNHKVKDRCLGWCQSKRSEELQALMNEFKHFDLANDNEKLYHEDTVYEMLLHLKSQIKTEMKIEYILTKYSEFLEESGYTDSDWREEEPTAINKFILHGRL